MFSRMFGKGKPTEDGKEKDLAHLHIPPIPEPSISTDYTKTMRTKILQENPKEGKETLNVAKFREIITSELEIAKKDFADDKLFLAANRVGKLRLFVESLAAGKADAENRDTNKDVEGGEDYEKLAEQSLSPVPTLSACLFRARLFAVARSDDLIHVCVCVVFHPDSEGMG